MSTCRPTEGRPALARAPGELLARAMPARSRELRARAMPARSGVLLARAMPARSGVLRARAPRSVVLWTLALLLTSGAARSEGSFRVEIDEPVLQESRVRFELVEVRGRAGSARGRGHDLVIVIDLSDSVLRDSGVDLDRDGEHGQTDPELLARLSEQPHVKPYMLRLLSERRDFEDTVLAAELSAAEALIERLDPRRFRVGIVTFSDRARVVAPLGSSPEQLRQALEEIRQGFHRELRGTNFALAIDKAVLVLAPQDPSRRDERELDIVFLSDGAPTLPVHADRARDYALESAAVAGLSGIRLHAFAIGTDAGDAMPLLHRMTELTGGRAERVDRPAEVIDRLRNLDLARIRSLRLVNATTGKQARAVRVFPDGSFDGIVGLAAGPNDVRVIALSEESEEATDQRRVILEPGQLEGDEAARARALLDALRQRTEELRLWADMEKRRKVQKRELEMHPELATPDPPSSR